MKGNFIDTRATDGDTHLGGEDFTNAMVQECLKRFKDKFQHELTDKTALSRLRNECELKKTELSQENTNEEIIEIPKLTVITGSRGNSFRTTIKRSEFEKLVEDLVKRCVDFLDKVIKAGKIKKERID